MRLAACRLPARARTATLFPGVAVVLSGLLLTVGVAGGCDAGPRAEPEAPPLVRLLGANVGPNQPLPEDGALELAFDRHLSPLSVTRQAVAVLDKAGEAAKSPLVTYDPVARTVRLSNPNPDGSPWLRAGEAYDLVLLRPRTADDTTFGLRAFDGAPLDPSVPAALAFRVVAGMGAPAREPRVHFCADVLPTLAGKCGGGTCHGPGERAAAGLVLTTSEGVAGAIGRVANGANTGGRAGAPSSAGPVFGVQMPLVEPGSPGQSWLLYKTLLAALPPADAPARPRVGCRGEPGLGSSAFPAETPPYVPLAPGVAPPSEAERAALGDAVLGREMPYPLPGAAKAWESRALDFAERERLRLWIAQGAAVPACGVCGRLD